MDNDLDMNYSTFQNNGVGIIEVADLETSNKFISKAHLDNVTNIKKNKQEIRKSDLNFPYIKASLMTDAEIQFYHFMQNNICQIDRISIFPKVRLADIINVDSRITLDKNALYKIAYKHVDFLICNKNTIDTICVIELDDYTHNTDKAKSRDLFVMQALLQAGIPVARIKRSVNNLEKSDLYFADEIINKAFAPLCPRCGKKMNPKSSRYGHRFYACEDFENCRKTIDIDTRGEKLP